MSINDILLWVLDLVQSVDPVVRTLLAGVGIFLETTLLLGLIVLTLLRHVPKGKTTTASEAGARRRRRVVEEGVDDEVEESNQFRAE